MHDDESPEKHEGAKESESRAESGGHRDEAPPEKHEGTKKSDSSIERWDHHDEEPRSRRRRSSRRFRDTRPAQSVSALGVISLILGVKGLFLSVIPCIGVIGLIPTGLGLMLGLIGVFTARSSGGRVGMGLPLAGSVVSGMGAAVALAWLLMFAGLFHTAADRNNLPANCDLSGTDEGLEIKISAVDLETAYLVNAPAADVKYKGKLLEVTGKLVSAVSEVGGQMTVDLEGGTRGQLAARPLTGTVHCLFPREMKKELAGYKVGDVVSIHGICKGQINGRLSINPCFSSSRVQPAPVLEKMEGRVLDITLANQIGSLLLKKNSGETIEVALNDQTQYLDHLDKPIEDRPEVFLLKEDVGITYEKVKGELVASKIVQRPYSAPQGDRVAGRLKDIEWRGIGGTLFLVQNNIEKKYELTDESRFFEADGTQIHEDPRVKLKGADIVVIVGKLNGKPVVLDVTRALPKK